MPISRTANLFGWVILAAAVLVVIFSSIGSYSYNRFKTRVRMLDEAGELPSLDEMVHIVENEKDDANFYLRKVLASGVSFEEEIVPYDETGQIVVDEQSAIKLHNFQTDHPEVFENLKLAGEAADISLDVNSEHGEYLLQVHRFNQILVWKAKVHLFEEDGERALDVALSLMQLAEKFDRPILFDTLFSMSMRVMAWDILGDIADQGLLTQVDDAQLVRVNNLLDDNDFFASFKNALMTERASIAFNMLNPENVEHSEIQIRQNPLMWLVAQLPAGPTIVAGNAYLDQMEIALERIQTPLTEDIQVASSASRWNVVAAFGGDLGSVFVSFRKQFGDQLAMNKAIRIKLALSRQSDAIQRNDWTSDYLQSIGVPATTMIDPYTGQSMLINRQQDKWVVYSTGADRRDDGGCQLQDVGIGLPIRETKSE